MSLNGKAADAPTTSACSGWTAPTGCCERIEARPARLGHGAWMLDDARTVTPGHLPDAPRHHQPADRPDRGPGAGKLRVAGHAVGLGAAGLHRAAGAVRLLRDPPPAAFPDAAGAAAAGRHHGAAGGRLLDAPGPARRGGADDRQRRRRRVRAVRGLQDRRGVRPVRRAAGRCWRPGRRPPPGCCSPSPCCCTWKTAEHGAIGCQPAPASPAWRCWPASALRAPACAARRARNSAQLAGRRGGARRPSSQAISR